MTFLFMYKDENDEIEISTTSAILSIFFTIVLAIFLLAKHDIQNKYKSNQTVSIITNDTVLVCSEKTNILYLGKTDSYVFIRNLNNNTSTVIPVSQIKGYLIHNYN